MSAKEKEEVRLEYKGTYIKCDLIPVKKINHINYGWISTFDQDCIYILAKTLIPVIIDQMKPIFGLNKLGCFYNDRYIIYTPCILRGMWTEEMRLTEYEGELTESQKREVRKILVFRYIVGLTSIHERSVLIRGKKLYDYGGESIKFDDRDRYLTKAVHVRWFKETSMVDTLKGMIKRGKKFDQINDILEIRIKLERIVKKIDKKYLNIVSVITDRISLTLDTCL
jgi:hypothetical protein